MANFRYLPISKTLLKGCALLCLSLTTAVARTTSDPYPQAARSYLLTVNDQVLWQHDAQKKLPPASLTKLLTALVLLDSHWSADRWISVSIAAAHVAPTRIGLRSGEQVRAGAALAAMLIHSANDACMALVMDSEPTLVRFVARMNALAATLGMSQSNFVDPCGFDAPGQYSTAVDLLKLAHSAHEHPLVALLTATAHASLQTRATPTHAGRSISFATSNKLLANLPGTIGMKSGYTQQAGECLIALVRRDNHEVWLVMLGSKKRWWLAHAMIEEAFDVASSSSDELRN